MANMAKCSKILIVDDNEDILFSLKLELETLFEKIKTTTQPERIRYFMETFRPNIILLDMNFCRDSIDGEEGFAYLEQILSWDSQAIVIFITAYADMEKAVRAIKAGATDFIPKPWEREKLHATLSSALKLSQSRQEIKRLQKQVSILNEDQNIPELIGESPALLQMKETILQLAETNANILIMGENGTGKDVVAHMIKHFSPRRDAPLVTIDLGCIPEQLFESELFGYEKGAFTDAQTSKPGRMEMASGGTLFLDEIGNLSLPMQAKLLTALEKRSITRLGATKACDIDIRLICATNANLTALAREGKFRQDLLYRINTIELHIPPLRERGKDIILLALHFLKLYNRKYKKNITGLNTEAKNKLMKYHWPGNVRELQHIMERATILTRNQILQPGDLILSSETESTSQINENEVLNLETVERQTIEKAICRSNGNLSYAAELLGITRFALYRKISKLNL